MQNELDKRNFPIVNRSHSIVINAIITIKLACVTDTETGEKRQFKYAADMSDHDIIQHVTANVNKCDCCGRR